MGLFSFIGSIIGGNGQEKAADKAAQLQYDAAMAGINATQAQYNQSRADYEPFRQLGVSAVPQFSDLLGLGTEDAQNSAIERLKNGPIFQQRMNAGQDAILATASATGGMRGGNTIYDIASLGDATLSDVIAQQLAGYGSAIGIGSGATDSVSNLGALATSQSNALRNSGAAAQAGAVLTKAGINAQNWKNAGGMFDDAASILTGGGTIGSALKSLF